jgi:hypothetical protein
MLVFRITLVWVFTMMVTLNSRASAQWFHYPTPGVPKTADGRPDLKAPTPKTGDGKPDLSGVWNPQNTLRNSDGFHCTGLFCDIGTDMKGGLPYQPWAAQLVKERISNNQKDSPDAKCLPFSPTQLDTHPSPKRTVQVPGMLIILDERWTNFRTIYTDGRPLPVDLQPSWIGYSAGKWEGDTLVVQTVGLKDDTWLDDLGSPMTSGGKITERFRRADYGNLEIAITVDDTKAYTKPWTVTVNEALMLDYDLLEGFCELEKDQSHLVGK